MCEAGWERGSQKTCPGGCTGGNTPKTMNIYLPPRPGKPRSFVIRGEMTIGGEWAMDLETVITTDVEMKVDTAHRILAALYPGREVHFKEMEEL